MTPGAGPFKGLPMKGPHLMEKTLIILSSLILLFAAPAYPGWWGPSSSRGDLLKKEKSLEDVRRQIREEKRNIRDIAGKETGILGELERIDRNLASKRDELNSIENSLVRLRKDINYSTFHMQRLEAERKALGERLKDRMRAMYRMRNDGVLNVLFSSDKEGGADLGRRTKYLTLIMDRDRALMEALRRNLERISAEKKRYEGLKVRLEAEKRGAALKKAEAEGLRAEKTALLDGVKIEKEKSQSVVKELEEAAVELSTLIRQLKTEEEAPQANGFSTMKGSLPMPVEGSVVSYYGKVKHPKFNTVTFNNGIIIEAPSGSPVKSVYGGKVVYSGWLKGYGQIMIIEHGGGFYTLFAHLQKALKEKGESVSSGEGIALVGDSGPEPSSGLYFEIRERGVPKDPLSWLASR